MRTYKAANGTTWTVAVQSPGSSNAIVLFRHPDQSSTRLDRYAWYITRGSEAHDVTSRLDKKAVLNALKDEDIQRLFRRSMPVSTNEVVAPGSSEAVRGEP